MAGFRRQNVSTCRLPILLLLLLPLITDAWRLTTTTPSRPSTGRGKKDWKGGQLDIDVDRWKRGGG
jgi:hypothetical protein